MRKRMRWMCFIIALLISSSFGRVFVSAAHNIPNIVVDGKLQTFSAHAPYVKDGRTLVAAEEMSDILRASIRYGQDSQKIVVTYGQTILVMRLNSNIATVNAVTKKMDSAPVMSQGVLMIPLRFFVESIDLKLVWDEETKTVFITKPRFGNVTSRKLLTPVGIQASDQNLLFGKKASVFDQDYSTRWAAKGKQWIMYDFANTKMISSVNILWIQPEGRQYLFDLEFSLDGENWFGKMQLKSSGVNSGFESFPIPGITARYVRYFGYGNNVNDWNSIAEIEVLGE